MAYKAVNVRNVGTSESQLFSMSAFKGLNLATTPTEIGDTESPDMLNITVDPYGSIEKRRGYQRVFPTSLGAGRITGLLNFKKKDGSIMMCLTHGTKFYKMVDNIPLEVTTPHGMNPASKVKSFVMNDYMFIQDGQHYYRFDGTTMVDVESVAYIPTISISRAPNGLETNFNEGFNLLQPGFKDSFSGNDTDALYFLSQDNLDATPVVIEANAITYTEGVNFTVNRVAGTIDFSQGTTPLGIPGKGTNNVLITAYKTHAELANFIKACRFNILYGGANDTKIFIAGDKEDINVLRYSATYDPTYFAENDYIQVGANNEAITGFTIQYDTLIIHKENSKWNTHYEIDNNGYAYFPIRPINDTIGCIAEDSIAIINNDPIALADTGVYILKGSNVRDERNVESVSINVDSMLLKEENIKEAIAIDFNNKYILVINNNAYVFDYYQGIWFKWNNIKANNFLIHKNELYFGSNEQGLLYRFYTDKDKKNLYNDDGEAIKCYWRSKIMSFGVDSRTKLIDKIFFSMKPGSPSSVDIFYQSDLASLNEVGGARRRLISYYAFSYNDWSYKATIYPDLVPIKLRAKKVIYLQLIFENNRLDDSMTILNIDIKYTVQGFKK